MLSTACSFLHKYRFKCVTRIKWNHRSGKEKGKWHRTGDLRILCREKKKKKRK